MTPLLYANFICLVIELASYFFHQDETTFLFAIYILINHSTSSCTHTHSLLLLCMFSFSGYLKQESAISGIVDHDNPVYVIVTVCPIILDSLFLYIPMINEEAKCLMLDENLKKIALVFRSMIDLPYVIVGIVFIVLAIAWWRTELRDDKEALLLFTILGLFGIIGALPIPQVRTATLA